VFDIRKEGIIMKKILFLTHIYPYPPNDGGKIVTYNTLKAFENHGFELTILTFISEQDKVDGFPIECDLNCIPINYSNSKMKALINLFSKYPFNMVKYMKKNMIKLLYSKLSENDYDLVYLDHLHMAYYGSLIKKKFPNVKIVLRQHNIESLLMKRYYEGQENWLIKKYFKFQYNKLYKFESEIMDNFDECFLITEEDYNLMKEMNSSIKISVLPAGVDIDKYYPINIKLEKRPTITFLGSLSWIPNIDGVSWFAKDVFPNVLKEIPDLLFYIVGKNPNKAILDLQKQYPENIKVTGFVEDERQYISTSDVFVVPLKIGGGMRIKILNALAMKRVIVTTSIGAEGINIDKNSFLLADTSKDFIENVLYVLKNKKIADNIAFIGYSEIISKYGNEVILKQHVKYLEEYVI
jgi:polysaccharide biosynthesis protein PslH